MVNEREEETVNDGCLSVSFRLKQITVFHHRFGCYTIDVRLGSRSKRSPTINLLKERINLDVEVLLDGLNERGQDLEVSLYNQTLLKGKQIDILISKQTLRIEEFADGQQSAGITQRMEFSQGGQLKAEIKYAAFVEDFRKKDESGDSAETGEPKRDFKKLLLSWMSKAFLPSIIAKVSADEITKRQQLELAAKLRQSQNEKEAAAAAAVAEKAKAKAKLEEAEAAENARISALKSKLKSEELIKQRAAEEKAKLQAAAAAAVKTLSTKQCRAQSVQVVLQTSDDSTKLKPLQVSISSSSMTPKDHQQVQQLQRPRRNFMAILKEGMKIFLQRLIIRFEEKQPSLSSSVAAVLDIAKLMIFGDESYPYIIEVSPGSGKVSRLSLPRSLAVYRYAAAVGLPNGFIMLCGGVNSKLTNIVPFVSIYDPFTHRAWPLPSMEVSRYTHSATYYDGYVYVIGGRTYGSGESSILGQFERFSLSSGKWEKLQRLKEGRCTTSIVGVGGFIYVLGGFSQRGRLRSIERYSIVLNIWEKLQSELPIDIEAGVGFAMYPSANQSRRGSSGVKESPSSLTNSTKKVQSPWICLMYGRGNKQKNDGIYRISISGSQEDLTAEVERIGKVTKTRVLPAYFVDPRSASLIVVASEDGGIPECERVSLKTFAQNTIHLEIARLQGEQIQQQLVASTLTESTNSSPAIGVFPKDMKMFSSAVSLRLDITGEEESQNQPQNRFIFLNNNEHHQQTTLSLECLLEGDNGFKRVQQQSGDKAYLHGISPSANFALADQNSLLAFGGKSSRECWLVHANSSAKRSRSACLNSIINAITYSHKAGESFIYVFGGESGSPLQSTTFASRYNIAEDKWERLNDMPIAMSVGISFSFIDDYKLEKISVISVRQKVILVTFNIASKLFEPVKKMSLIYEWTFAFQFFQKRKRGGGGKANKITIDDTRKGKTPSPYIGLLSASLELVSVIDLRTGEQAMIDESGSLKEQMRFLANAAFIGDSNNKVRVLQEIDIVSVLFSKSAVFFKALVDISSVNEGIERITFSIVPGKDRAVEASTPTTAATPTAASALGKKPFSEQKVFFLRHRQTDMWNIEEDRSISSSKLLVVSLRDDSLLRVVSHETSTAKEEDIVEVDLSQTNVSSNIKFDPRNNKAYISGGSGALIASSIFELDFKGKTTKHIGDMITSRAEHCSVIVGNFMYFIGGVGFVLHQKQKTLQRMSTEGKFFRKQTKEIVQLTTTTTTSPQHQLWNNLSAMKGQTSEQVLLPLIQQDISAKSLIMRQSPSTFLGGGEDNNGGGGGGGESSLSPLKKVERLNLITREVEQVAELQIAVSHAGCCYIKEQSSIFIVGGVVDGRISGGGGCSPWIQRYHIPTNSWQMLTDVILPISLRMPSCLCIDGSSQLLIAGGIDKDNMAVLDVFIVDFNEWKKQTDRRLKRIAKLAQPHVSQQAFLEGEEGSSSGGGGGGFSRTKRRLILYDKDYAQELTNFEDAKTVDDVYVREIAGFSCLRKERAVAWWAAAATTTAVAAASQTPVKKEEFRPSSLMAVFGNEKQRVSMLIDMNSLRAREVELPRDFSLFSSTVVVQTQSNDNSLDVVLIGGIDSTTGKVISRISFLRFQFASQSSSSTVRLVIADKDEVLLLPRFVHGVVVIDRYIYVIGGKTSSVQLGVSSSADMDNAPRTECTSECEVFDCSSRKQQRIASLSLPRSNFSAIAIEGKIYVFGGFSGNKRLRSIERYSPLTDGWDMVDCVMPFDIEGYTLTGTSRYEVAVIGGKDNGVLSSKILLFNAKLSTVTELKAGLGGGGGLLSPMKCGIDFDHSQLIVFGIQQSQNNRPLRVTVNLRSAEITASANQQHLFPFQQNLDVSWASVQLSMKGKGRDALNSEQQQKLTLPSIISQEENSLRILKAAAANAFGSVERKRLSIGDKDRLKSFRGMQASNIIRNRDYRVQSTHELGK